MNCLIDHKKFIVLPTVIFLLPVLILSLESDKFPCKRSDEFFDNEAKKNSPVFASENRGPCGVLMTYKRIDEYYGQCCCLAKAGCPRRPTLYFPSKKRCYYAFLQGPCKDDEWTVYNGNTGYGECKKRTCALIGTTRANATDEDVLLTKPFVFIHENKCYKTETRAFCDDDDEKAYFLGSSQTPECETQKDCAKNSGIQASRGDSAPPASTGCSGQETNENDCGQKVTVG